jgi:hypothetical protein
MQGERVLRAKLENALQMEFNSQKREKSHPVPPVNLIIFNAESNARREREKYSSCF